jgi:hypothetical protein
MIAASRRISPVLFVLAIAGCAMAPPYPGSPAPEPRDLRPIKHNGVTISVPAGWELEPDAPNSPELLRATLKKSGTTVKLQIHCHSPFVTRDGTADIMHAVVRSVLTGAERVRGPYALGSSIAAPVLEGYTGRVTWEGNEQQMISYVAYNVDALTCKYGLFLIGSAADASRIEPEFVAMLRSL